MPRKPCFVTPHTGVVDDNRIVNTVLCVINGIGGVRVNDLDLIAIGDKGLALVIDAYRALKGPVYRITAQQACTLFKIVGRFTLTHHNGSQSQTIATISLINQNTGQKATNAAKTIQHHVLRLGQRLASEPYQRVQFPIQVLLQTQAVSCALQRIPYCQTTDIDMCRPQIQLAQPIKHRKSLLFGQLISCDLPHIAVVFHYLVHRPIDQWFTVDITLNVLFAGQLPHQRNHAFSQCLALLPVFEVVVRTRSLGLVCHLIPLIFQVNSGRVLLSDD